MRFFLVIVLPLLSVLVAGYASGQTQPTVIYCKFERLPVMEFIFRGGMGADDNTLRLGERNRIPLSVGSGLMTADTGAQEFVFSLRLPPSVTITNQGSGGTATTYYGECTPPVVWEENKPDQEKRPNQSEPSKERDA